MPKSSTAPSNINAGNPILSPLAPQPHLSARLTSAHVVCHTEDLMQPTASANASQRDGRRTHAAATADMKLLGCNGIVSGWLRPPRSYEKNRNLGELLATRGSEGMNAQRAMKRQALKKMDSLPAPRLRPYHSSRTAHHQRPPQKIIANGSVLHSKRSADKNAPDDHIEVVAIATRVIRTGPAQFTSFSTSNTDAGDEEKHYAILIRRAGSQVSMKMILKGEAKDLVVEALEWMTAKAEQMIHGWSVKTAKDD